MSSSFLHTFTEAVKESSQRTIVLKAFKNDILVVMGKDGCSNRILVEGFTDFDNHQMLSIVHLYLSMRTINFVVEFVSGRHLNEADRQLLPKGFVFGETESGVDAIMYGCLPTKVRFDYQQDIDMPVLQKKFTLHFPSNWTLYELSEEILYHIDIPNTNAHIFGIETDYPNGITIIADDTLLLSDVWGKQKRFVFHNVHEFQQEYK
jgi:hypothetical protein